MCRSRGRCGGAVDKVRGTLSLSAQRELLRLLDKLTFVGVPALPAPAGVARRSRTRGSPSVPSVRSRRAEGSVGERVVNVAGVTMERHITLLGCVDVYTGETRHLRLERIEHAVPEPSSA